MNFDKKRQNNWLARLLDICLILFTKSNKLKNKLLKFLGLKDIDGNDRIFIINIFFFKYLLSKLLFILNLIF